MSSRADPKPKLLYTKIPKMLHICEYVFSLQYIGYKKLTKINKLNGILF